MIILAILLTLFQTHRNVDIVYFGGTYYDFELNGFTRTIESQRVYAAGSTGPTRLFYEAETQIIDVTPSPSGTFIAIILNDGVIVHHRLVILDSAGKFVLAVDSVHRFCWSPDEREVLITKGKGREGGHGFRPTSTSIIDLRNGSNRVLDFITYYADWAEFDRKIHFKEFSSDRMMEYDPITGIQKPSLRKGTHFSRDGAYSFFAGRDGGEFKLYDRAGRDITNVVTARLGRTITDAQWTSDGLLLIRQAHDAKGSSSVILLDVANNVIMGDSKGRLLGVSGNMKRVFTTHSGRRQVVPLGGD